MKKIVITIMVLIFALSTVTYATGIGVMLGEPTGLSAKLWQGKNTAIAGGLAWSFANSNSAIHVHGDYLFHNYKLINAGFPVYYGLGAGIGIGDEFRLGVRVPIGIEYFFADKKFDAFFEIVPVLGLLPSTGFGVNGAIGIRYNF